MRTRRFASARFPTTAATSSRTPEEIAQLFSIARPLVSTKLLRLPTRGALGNGLRVVAGAVLASEGSLAVVTRNRRIVLRPERDGTTSVVGAEPTKFPVGTRVEISFGPALPRDADALHWARIACKLAAPGQTYAGRSSPWWYDATQFHELLTASGARPVRELIAHLDGCTGSKAGEIVAAAGLGRAMCKDINGEQARRLLTAARESARQVKPKRLGAVGPMFGSAKAAKSSARNPAAKKVIAKAPAKKPVAAAAPAKPTIPAESKAVVPPPKPVIPADAAPKPFVPPPSGFAPESAQ
jgi:hypothetical protein